VLVVDVTTSFVRRCPRYRHVFEAQGASLCHVRQSWSWRKQLWRRAFGARLRGHAGYLESCVALFVFAVKVWHLAHCSYCHIARRKFVGDAM